jgi:hypothetical protein
VFVLATPTNPGKAQFVPASDLGGASGSFVYRPGEPNPTGNVYADFNLLYSALILVQGTRTILYDNDLVAPLACSVPPRSGGGSYDFKNVSHTGSPNGEDGFPFMVPVQFEDGVTIENFGTATFLISFQSLSNTPIVTFSGGVNVIICEFGSTFQANGAAPFFQIDAGFLLFVGQAGADFQTGVSAVVNLAGPGATLQMAMFNASRMGNDVISGAVGSTASVLYDSTGDGITLTQTTMLGTMTFALYDFAERVGFVDNGGWPTPIPTNVQEAIDALKVAVFGQWADSITSWSTPIDGTVEVPTNFDRTLTVPANELEVGDVLEILAAGEYTTIANPGVDFARIGLSVGSFGFLNGNFGPVPGSGTQFIMKVRICIQTTGIVGTVFVYQENDFGIVISASYIPQQTGPHTFDTTIGSLISVEGYWGPGTPDGNSMVLKTLQANVIKKVG